MTHREFVSAARKVMHRIMDRTPRRWPPGFVGDDDDRARWPQDFMRDLLLILDDEQTPITPAERDTVVRLMRQQHMDLGAVERFNVSDAIGRVTDDMT